MIPFCITFNRLIYHLYTYFSRLSYQNVFFKNGRFLLLLFSGLFMPSTAHVFEGLLFCSLAELGIKLMASCWLTSPAIFLLFILRRVSQIHQVTEAGLEFVILQPLAPRVLELITVSTVTPSSNYLFSECVWRVLYLFWIQVLFWYVFCEYFSLSMWLTS